MKTRFKAIGLAAFFFAFMLIVWPTSCKKDPQPTPEPTTTDTVPDVPSDTIPDVPPVPPIDTIQPGGDTIVPDPGGDTIVPIPGQRVYFEYSGGLNIVSFDTLERYQNDPAYDSIILRLRITASPSWTPRGYKGLCDSLRPRFTRFPKLRGEWGILPYQILPDCDSMARDRMGIAEHHRDLLVGWHYDVYPQN
jgi:hypothetical protein